MSDRGESARRPVIPFGWSEVAIGRELGPTAFLVYCYLSLRAGRSLISWPSNRTIGRDLGLSPNTVQDALELLQANTLLGSYTEEVTSRGRLIEQPVWIVNDPPDVAVTDARKGSESIWKETEVTAFAHPKAPKLNKLAATGDQWAEARQLVNQMLALRKASLEGKPELMNEEMGVAKTIIVKYGLPDGLGCMHWLHQNRNGNPWRMKHVLAEIGQWLLDDRPSAKNGRSPAHERFTRIAAANKAAGDAFEQMGQTSSGDEDYSQGTIIEVPVKPRD